MRRKRTEVEVAEKVVAWLEDLKWEVYQEVPVGAGVADIVAVQGPVQWVIETKTGMSMQLLKQLDSRIGCAHMVSAAVPYGARSEIPYRLLKALGVGLLLLYCGEVQERLRPTFFRRIARPIELHESQKTFAKAGSPGGSHWSPFKTTSREVIGWVTANPGCTLRDMLTNVRHHYDGLASAKRNIVHWIDAGVIPGIRVERGGREIRLFPEANG